MLSLLFILSSWGLLFISVDFFFVLFILFLLVYFFFVLLLCWSIFNLHTYFYLLSTYLVYFSSINFFFKFGKGTFIRLSTVFLFSLVFDFMTFLRSFSCQVIKLIYLYFWSICIYLWWFFVYFFVVVCLHFYSYCPPPPLLRHPIAPSPLLLRRYRAVMRK